ncbi:MAG: type II secretion system secretin GspD [Polyangiales bacterium]
MRTRTAVPILFVSAIVMLAGLRYAHAQPPGQRIFPPPPGNPDTAQPPGGAPAMPPPPTAAGAPAAPGGPRQPMREFETGVDYRPVPPGTRVTFNLEDADLPDLVRLISSLTGQRFILPGKMRSIKASVFAPTKVTAAEAYNAFLSILEVNGMTVVPSGRYLKIIDTQGAETQPLPVNGGGAPTPGTDRYYTRMHPLENVTAEDVAQLLSRFKSRDGNVTAYAPTNMIIMTDTGAQIQRMLRIIEAIDVPRTGEQIWIEPIHYADADELAQRLTEIFGTATTGSPTPTPAAPPPQTAGADGQGGGGVATIGARRGESRISKIIADERTNSLIILATERAYMRILDMLRQLDVPLEGEGRIHVHYVQHGSADEIATTLTSLIEGTAPSTSGPATGGAPGGAAAAAASRVNIFEGAIRVTAHEPSNALVITSSLHDYAALRRVIERLDAPRRQVFIEAVIMELGAGNRTQFGVSWHTGVGNFPSNGALSVLGFNAGSSLNPLVNQDLLTSAALGIRGPTIPNSQQLVGISVPAFGVAITALAETGDLNILSTPHIIAMDNVQAEITIGENIPLQTNGIAPGALTGLAGATGLAGLAGQTTGATGLSSLSSLGGLGSVPRQDVGTTLRVTPHINDANEVRLEIEEEISDKGTTEGTLGVVSINRRKAKTEIMVRDQQTVVIGGLMRDTMTRRQSKVPVLGDIPVIGALFRKTTNERRKVNLLLVLTPYIIRDPSDLRAIFERKMRERQEFLDRYFVFGDRDYEPVVDYSRTRGFIAEMLAEVATADDEARLAAETAARPAPEHRPRAPVGSDRIPGTPEPEERQMIIGPEGISYDNPNPELAPGTTPEAPPATPSPAAPTAPAGAAAPTSAPATTGGPTPPATGGATPRDTEVPPPATRTRTPRRAPN